MKLEKKRVVDEELTTCQINEKDGDTQIYGNLSDVGNMRNFYPKGEID